MVRRQSMRGRERQAWRQRQWGLMAMMLCGFLVWDSSARAQSAVPVKDPVQLLTDIQQAARSQDYSGVFMYQQGDSIQSSRLVHVVDGTGERERLQILDGQPREYLRHNEDVQCLIPDRKTVLLERRRGDRFPGLLLGDPKHLMEYYTVREEPRLHRVADRECRLISIEPLDDKRYGYRICADVDTNLLLKAQTVDGSRGVVEQVSFTSLRVGSDVDASQLSSRWNTRDWDVIESDMQPVDLAAQGWRIPAPSGFLPVKEVSRKMNKGTVSQLVLSDGLAAISVFIEPYDGARHQHPPAGLGQRGAINIYGSRIADYWMTVLGEVPAATLESLAEATEYVPESASH